MKTAISLPDDLFEAVDRTAAQLGISRSELFARAARAYLNRHAPEDVRRSYDEAYRSAETTQDREARRRSAREVLSRVEW